MINFANVITDNQIEMRTNCPNCNKTIEISEELLGSSRGRLVCPCCLEVFVLPGWEPNKENVDDSAGQPADLMAHLRYCPNCGAKVTSRSKFCPICGEDLIAAERERMAIADSEQAEPAQSVDDNAIDDSPIAIGEEADDDADNGVAESDSQTNHGKMLSPQEYLLMVQHANTNHVHDMSPSQRRRFRRKIEIWTFVLVACVVAMLLWCVTPRSASNDLNGMPTSDYSLSDTEHVVSPAFSWMAKVDGGTFSMGNADSTANEDERPKHVVILNDFFIMKREVTQHMWQAIMGSNPSVPKGDKLPVVCVSWLDCVKFCNKLSRHYKLRECYCIDGSSVTLLHGGHGGFRLPTEAEWEYAARGGKSNGTAEFSGGDDLDDLAWYGGNSGVACNGGFAKIKRVGTKKPNELGLYDMTGNVWEWCWDYYGKYPSDSQTNPTGPSGGIQRVIRGGCWNSCKNRCAVLFRNFDKSTGSDNSVGLRLVYVP